MSDFIHLHNHTDFSLLDGAASISNLVGRALELGMEHLAITDHGNMFGAIQFFNACKKAGINPIIGSEFYVAPGSRKVKTGSESGNRYYHLVLLAKNNTGYQNLLILSSLGYTEGFYYKPRIDDEILQQYSEGLIGLSACLAGKIPALLLNGREKEAEEAACFYRDTLGEGSFYLELQDHGLKEQKQVNPKLVQLSKKTGIPLVATNDIHYTNQDDANAQDLLICIGTNKKKHDPNRMRFESDQFYLKPPQEMKKLFDEYPEALENSKKIAEQCNVEIPQPGPLLPHYEIPPEFSEPKDYFRHIVYKGLKKRYGEVTEEIRKRTDYELDIIIGMQFTGYFLIVWDFIRWAKDNGIPVGPGRGSGAGSVVAYAMEITDIDPFKYDLLFERFLNPERVSMPDFDVDFCFERRQEVIDYVTKKYGKEKVGQIITFGTLKSRAVIRDVARVLDIPYADADATAKLIPKEAKTLKDAIEMEPKLKELAENDNTYRELLTVSRKLEKLNRHASTHAAGIVIGQEELTKYVPLYRDPKTGSISTQFTMEELEPCGLVKMDFLGLKTLTLIKNTEKLIRKRGIDFSAENVPEDDEKTFKMLGEGISTCVFQFESQGMQGVLKKAKPQSIKELIALNALYRPGPMQFIDKYIDAKAGRIPIDYPLPELESVLKETYGVIVYQEQVMQVAQIVAGYSLGQADLLRRAMGKKKEKEMAKHHKLFLEGAEKKGYTEKQAEDIFNLLIPFSQYGFNKSHAAAYSVLAYKTAYLKANYPAEFMAANLTNEINDTDKLAEYIEEASWLGIEVLPPNVNLSEKNFTVVDGKIVYGLIGIKNAGDAAVSEIIRARKEEGKFTDLLDFLEKIDLRTVNRKVIETLIQCGALDDFEENRATLFHNLEKALEYASNKKTNRSFGQTSLFDSCEEEEFRGITYEYIDEWPKLECLNMEKQLVGFYFSGHPLDEHKAQWKRAVNLDLSHPEKAMTERKYTLLGLLKDIKSIYTKRGTQMAFATLEDFNGSIELVIFNKVYNQYSHMLENDKAVGVIGKIDTSKGDPKFKVDEIKNPNELEGTGPRSVHIRLGESSASEDDLLNLRETLIGFSGNCPVFLHVQKKTAPKEIIIKASNQICVQPDETLFERIRSAPVVTDVWKD